MARKRSEEKKGKKRASPPERGPRFPKFSYLPAEIQWKIFREVMNSEPQFHVLRVGRVDDAAMGTWRLSFSPVTKGKDNSGYRMCETLSTVNPSAAAAVHHELTLRKRRQFQRLPFKILNARINGATDLVVLDFARSLTPAIGYFHHEHQILNWLSRRFDSDSVAKQFENTEKVAIKLSHEHYSCHSMMGNFRCADREDWEHSSHTSPTNDWLMCPKELAGLLNSFPKLREFYIILPLFHGNNKQDEAGDAYVKNYLAWTQRHHHTHTKGFTGIGMSYLPLIDELATEAFGDDGSAQGRFPSLQDLREIRAMLASLEDYFHLDSRLLQPGTPLQPAETYRLSRAERDRLAFRVLIAVSQEKIRQCGGR
ncbi:hypothetical protein B0I37DRAFT_405520 [Chaetomium sp. MPI-CAGE-AT-0009]|nr:hypothetical protein B0I37DRAFT_405520 [Chaetomium sp. MPI-CAGE-AT-0009]